MQDSVTVHVKATPQQVWDLVSDVTRIGEYSPETFEAEWLDGATGPEVGARFRGHVKRNGIGPIYWSECTVTSAVPQQEFGFSVGPSGKVLNNWKYVIVPAADGDGVDVTESFHLGDGLPLKIYWTLLGWARGRTNVKGMRTTLERIKAELEGTPAP